jgi:anti-sigma B factor antagonist
MKITQKEIDNVVVLELSGKIMGGPDATTLNDKLHALVETGKTKVVADLSKVNWMNSSGLGILISALTTIRNAGGDLKLAEINARLGFEDKALAASVLRFVQDLEDNEDVQNVYTNMDIPEEIMKELAK